MARWEQREARAREHEEARERRADLRAGIVAATIANVNRRKNTRARRAEEFMPQVTSKTERPVATPKARAAYQMALAQLALTVPGGGARG